MSYYKSVPPKDAHMYFNKEMLALLMDNLEHQILTKEEKHLAAGEGVFIFEKATKNPLIKIAVHARWICDLNPPVLKNIHVLQYHLFDEEIPDELLDNINELSKAHPPEWKTYE